MANCNRCGKPITWAGKDEQGRWIRNNPDGTRHSCTAVTETAPPTYPTNTVPSSTTTTTTVSAPKNQISFDNKELQIAMQGNRLAIVEQTVADLIEKVRHLERRVNEGPVEE